VLQDLSSQHFFSACKVRLFRDPLKGNSH
jgi:hypothetical protein